MDNKNTKTVGSPDTKSKRLIIIFTAIFLGAVLLFGIVLGTVALIRNSRSYLSYKGVAIDGGVANYLAMMAKYEYMSALAASGVDCYDDDYFWQSEADDGRTYKEHLLAECDSYIKRVLVGSYFFDKNAKLTKEDKEKIDEAVKSVLGNFSDREAFDGAAKDSGFDFKDVKRAVKLIYKYNLAQTVIFGHEGEALKSGEFDAELDEFYSGYSYAKLLFIRTEDKFVKDPDSGKIELEKLDEVERELLFDKIERIRYLIGGKGGEVISEDTVDYYIGEFSSDEMNRTSGYYLSPTSSHTLKLNAVYPEVVSAVISAKEESYTEVETEYGVCFIYKTALPTRGYLYPSNDAFFTDFYDLAARRIYFNELVAYSKDVEVKDKYLTVDFVALPYDYRLTVRF